MSTDRSSDDYSPPGWARVDRLLVRWVTGAAAMFFGLLMVTWIVTGDAQFMTQSAAPVAVAGSGVLMLMSDRPSPVVQLSIGGLGLIWHVTMNGIDVPGDPIIALMVMSIAGVALLRRHAMVFGFIATLVLAACGYGWHPDAVSPGERAVVSFTVAASFALTAGLLQVLKSSSAADRARLRELVDTKDEFVATVSHELRTPLTAVVGFALELHDRVGEFSREEIEEFTALLVAESSDIAHIVEDLLVAARADRGSLELQSRTLDIAEVAVAAAADSTGVDSSEVTGHRIEVVADPTRVRQILRNLIVNATRYGGDAVRVVGRIHDAVGVIEVRDDGPAVPPADRERIFEPYQRVEPGSPVVGSLGLGLTVSRRLARMMGGDVTYAHDGAESVFELSLPLSEATVERLGV